MVELFARETNIEKKHIVIFSRPLSPKEVDRTKINISINAPLAGLTESHRCLVHIPLYYGPS